MGPTLTWPYGHPEGILHINDQSIYIATTDIVL